MGDNFWFLECLSLPSPPPWFWIQFPSSRNSYLHSCPGQHIPTSHCRIASSKEAFPVSKIKVKSPVSTFPKHPALAYTPSFTGYATAGSDCFFHCGLEPHENRGHIYLITIISPEPRTWFDV